MAKMFSAGEFLKSLRDGTLRKPVVKEGMAKQDEGNPAVVLFSEGRLCQSWIRIPTDAIDHVEHLGTVRCDDHEHPLVRIYLKEPPTDDKLAVALMELLRSSPQAASGASMLRHTPKDHEPHGPCNGHGHHVAWRAHVKAKCLANDQWSGWVTADADTQNQAFWRALDIALHSVGCSLNNNWEANFYWEDVREC
jgi:hypothetical protein